jgi:hypothetical protein
MRARIRKTNQMHEAESHIKANSYSFSQEIPHTLCNQNIYYRV